MKHRDRVVLLAVFLGWAVWCGVVTAQGPAATRSYVTGPSHRIAKTINREWTFNYFAAEDADEAGCQAPGFDDTEWPAVAVPHSWSTYETTGERHPYIRNPSERDSDYWWYGWGWYRKHFVVSDDQRHRKVCVEFDAVQKYCKVWLNGQWIGDHKGGFNSFTFDLTDHVRFGQDNVLAVAVSNRRNDERKIPPMTAGNWDVYGGIYRDVRLVIKDRLHIPFQGDYRHEGGTFVTTPEVSADEGVVRVRTWVKNDYAEPRECELTTVIADADERIVQVLKERRRIDAGVLHEFDQRSAAIARPQLWSPDNPYVYTVHSEVRDGGRVVDRYASPLGFRWFRWDDDERRLYLNGQKIHIQGTNRHQEYPWLGDAMPKWMHVVDMNDIRRNLNYNFMRTCHYTQDPIIYEFCDRTGIIINEEVPNIKKQTFSDEVQRQQLQEMIRRDRNHPCILFWSMGNETTDAADSAWTLPEDTSRIIHARHIYNDSAGQYVTHTHEQMGMESLLQITIRGWYGPDEKDLQPESGQHATHESWQHDRAVARLKKQQSYRKIDDGKANVVTWLYEDHGADREYMNAPLKHVNPKGWVDSYRMPKYMYYLWQANYTDKPMVFVHPHYWRSKYRGRKKEIVVDSNCDSVALQINGRTHAALRPRAEDYYVVRFADVPIESGTLTAVGTKGDVVVRSVVTMAGQAARLVLTASHDRIEAGRDSVAIIKADIVDANGVHVYGATNTLKWSVQGPATLVGPAVYTSDIDKHEAMDGTMYIDAPVCNIIRSTGRPGIIRVRAMASGLALGSVEIQAVPAAAQAVAGISEPTLPEGRRRPVQRNKVLSQASEPRPAGEMKEAEDDVLLKADSESDYRRQIDALLRRDNPGLDDTTAAYRALREVFARHLMNNQGSLVRDDYNFSVFHYNDCRQIARCIDETRLPLRFKQDLKAYYAECLIGRGQEKKYEQERQWIRGIPTNAIVVVVRSEEPASVADGVTYTSSDDIAQMIRQIHPEFERLDADEKAAVLEALAALNPYITRDVVSLDKKNIRAKYTIEPGRAILIPKLDRLTSK